MNRVINAKDILTAHTLIKQLNGTRHSLVKEVAKKLKYDELELMRFINENPKLFATEHIMRYRNKKVKRYLFPRTREGVYETIEQVQAGIIGLGFINVYTSAEHNYRTDEWLERTIENNKHHIQIKEWSNYGHIEGYHVSISRQDEYRRHLWLNTPEKVAYLKEQGVFHTKTFFIGGFGDSSSTIVSTAINDDGIKKIESLGWTHEGYPQKHKS